MNPEDVERLLGRVEPASPPERLERNILAEGASRLARPSRERRIWGVSGVAAASLILGVVLWRILVPHPGDPGWAPCRVAIEWDTHLDTSMAARPPAFPTGAPSLEDYAPLFLRADAVKPLAEELRWTQIPWITDLEAAQQAARAERRPLFVWVSSDDPLGRCCGCAAGLRAGPLSQEEVVRRVSAGFVPLALDRKLLLKGKGEEFLKSLRRQKPQYHGIWIVSPEGRVLAAHENQKILEMLETSLAAFGSIAPRKAVSVDPLQGRGTGLQPDGSVSLAVVARLMRKGARDGPAAFDHLTLSAAEWAQLVPPQLAPGTEWVVPDAIARKFCGILSPVSDADLMPRPDQAKKAELRATVASIHGGTATLTLSGRWETEHAVSEGKPIRASASGEGVVLFDLEKKAIRSFLLVTKGDYAAGSEPREAGAVVEWAATRP